MKPMPAVCIRFYDHFSADATALEGTEDICEVFGILYKEDKDCYYVASWIADGQIFSPNTDAYKIRKATVISVQRLVPQRRRK